MIPREQSVGRAVITQVVPESPAAGAGIKQGDIIQTIDNRDIPSVQDASYNIRLHLGENIPIEVQRTDPVTKQVQTIRTFVKPRWSPPDYLYTVQPGQDVNAVATATGFDRDSVRAAAGIESVVHKDQHLSIDHNGDVIDYTAEADTTVAAISQQLRLPDAEVAAAAGLPDQGSLPAGKTLHFTQGATGIRIGPQYDFTENQKEPPLTALRHGVRTDLRFAQARPQRDYFLGEGRLKTRLLRPDRHCPDHGRGCEAGRLAQPRRPRRHPQH